MHQFALEESAVEVMDARCPDNTARTAGRPAEPLMAIRSSGEIPQVRPHENGRLPGRDPSDPADEILLGRVVRLAIFHPISPRPLPPVTIRDVLDESMPSIVRNGNARISFASPLTEFALRRTLRLW